MTGKVSFTVNGSPVSAEIHGDQALLFHLRNRLGLRATRFGCGQERCGACVVTVDGAPAYACGTDISALEGRHVLTPEGLAADPIGIALAEAFAAESAGQCGYCLAGILMSAHALLSATPFPSEAQITEALDRHLCRCGAHGSILRAIRAAIDSLSGDLA